MTVVMVAAQLGDDSSSVTITITPEEVPTLVGTIAEPEIRLLADIRRVGLVELPANRSE